MNSKNLSELFGVIKVMQESNLEASYEEEIKFFTESLKGYLTSFLGTNIVFVGESPIGLIYAIYEGCVLTIDVRNGISLSINDVNKSSSLRQFEFLFSKISGQRKTCSYDYLERNSSKHVIEWSLCPEESLYNLSNDKNVKHLHDYYTPEVIESLGNDVLSMEGYIALFGNNDSQINDESYKLIQIQKLYPDLDTAALQAWIISCRSKLTLTKKAG